MPFSQISDMQIYYEIHGVGAPLVLLNGALGTIAADWHQHLPAFAARYYVLAYDHRGHGQSSALPTPWPGYDQLADDLAALLDTQGIVQAQFCGFSDGGITLLYFARRWPKRVKSLVLIGTQYTNDQRTLALLAKMTPERIQTHLPAWAARLEQLHNAHHGPGYWQSLLQQMHPIWLTQPDLTLAQLSQITAPTLFIAGERDNFGHPEQQVAMWRALAHAELCILPAAGHTVQHDQPDLFRQIVLNFLQRNENL